MNYKIKDALVLLFIVIVALLIIGSVNAANTDENNTLMDDSLSLENVGSIEETDNDISEDIIAINNDDGNEIEDTNSVVKVSKSNDKLGSQDGSDVLSAPFNIQTASLTPVVRVGDDVYFEVYVQNQWNTYYGNWWEGNVLTINNWFNDTELEFIEIIPAEWAINYVDLTPDVQYYGEDRSSYVPVQYRVYNGWQPWNSLKYQIHFKALKPGNFTYGAHIYDNGDYWGRSSVLVGDPELTIIKTPHQEVYCLGDDVYFDVYIENTGTLPLTTTMWWDPDNPDSQLIWIDDWYDTRLEFVDITFNPDKNGNRWDQNYKFAGEFDGAYGHQLLIQYLTYGNWEPGSSLNFTTHFKANGVGQLNNSAHVFWKWKYWGPDEVHRHIEEWGNSSVYVGVPEFTIEKVALTKEVKVGDDVIFNVTVTNTGKINLTGVYIQDNEYTNGLKYSDYSDKGDWTFDGTDKWTYNGTLAPGEAISLLLTFTATSTGVKNNTAVCGNNLTNETLNSTDNVTVTENETDDDDDPEVPEDVPEEDSEKEPEEEPEVPEENPSEDEVQVETSSVAKTATGNPLFVLLLCLIGLGFIPSRNKKQ